MGTGKSVEDKRDLLKVPSSAGKDQSAPKSNSDEATISAKQIDSKIIIEVSETTPISADNSIPKNDAKLAKIHGSIIKNAQKAKGDDIYSLVLKDLDDKNISQSEIEEIGKSYDLGQDFESIVDNIVNHVKQTKQVHEEILKPENKRESQSAGFAESLKTGDIAPDYIGDDFTSSSESDDDGYNSDDEKSQYSSNIDGDGPDLQTPKQGNDRHNRGGGSGDDKGKDDKRDKEDNPSRGLGGNAGDGMDPPAPDPGGAGDKIPEPSAPDQAFDTSAAQNLPDLANDIAKRPSNSPLTKEERERLAKIAKQFDEEDEKGKSGNDKFLDLTKAVIDAPAAVMANLGMEARKQGFEAFGFLLILFAAIVTKASDLSLYLLYDEKPGQQKDSSNNSKESTPKNRISREEQTYRNALKADPDKDGNIGDGPSDLADIGRDAGDGFGGRE